MATMFPLCEERAKNFSPRGWGEKFGTEGCWGPRGEVERCRYEPFEWPRAG